MYKSVSQLIFHVEFHGSPKTAVYTQVSFARETKEKYIFRFIQIHAELFNCGHLWNSPNLTDRRTEELDSTFLRRLLKTCEHLSQFLFYFSYIFVMNA